MKLLLLSCNMGEGHNSAARAVLEEALARDHSIAMKDALSFVDENFSDFLSKSYILSLRRPELFAAMYSTGFKVDSWKLGSPVYHMNKLYKNKLYQYIVDTGVEAVISTHMFPGQALAALRKEGKLPGVKSYGVATDYTCPPFWNEAQCDSYFIPHEELIPEFLRRGIPREALVPTGIPVKNVYLQKMETREARMHLGLSESRNLYLIMSGSTGFGHVGRILEAILRDRGKDPTVAVICGTNRRLREKLALEFLDFPNIRIYGYTREIPIFMDAADVIFTKPGGLTTTEAAVKCLPIVHTDPIPGVEEANYRFFSSRGMSLIASTPLGLARAAGRITSDPKVRESMVLAQKKYIHPRAAAAILDRVELDREGLRA